MQEFPTYNSISVLPILSNDGTECISDAVPNCWIPVSSDYYYETCAICQFGYYLKKDLTCDDCANKITSCNECWIN